MIQNLNGSGDLQDAVSGTDIKTVNGQSILCSGNLQLPAKRYIHYGICRGGDTSNFRIQWQFIANFNVAPAAYTAAGVRDYFLANGWNLGEYVPVSGHASQLMIYAIQLPAAANGGMVLLASDFSATYPGQNTTTTRQPSAVSNSQVLIKELY